MPWGDEQGRQIPTAAVSEPEPDPFIPASSIVYRRVASVGDANMLGWNEGTGELYVKSGAFRFDPDGCSVHRDALLAANGLSYRDLIRAPQNVILGIRVEQIRARGMGVRDTPWPRGHKPDALYQVAHASVLRGSVGKTSARRALAEESHVVHMPDRDANASA